MVEQLTEREFLEKLTDFADKLYDEFETATDNHTRTELYMNSHYLHEGSSVIIKFVKETFTEGVKIL